MAETQEEEEEGDGEDEPTRNLFVKRLPMKRKVCNPCCCLSLKTGCIIIGALECLSIGYAVYMIAVGADTSIGNKYWYEVGSTGVTLAEEHLRAVFLCRQSLPWVWATAYLFQGIAGALLLCAVLKNIALFCLVNIVLCAFALFLFLAEGILCAVSILYIFALIMALFMLPLMLYFIICVLYYRKQMKQGTETMPMTAIVEEPPTDGPPKFIPPQNQEGESSQSSAIIQMDSENDSGGTRESFEGKKGMLARRKTSSYPDEQRRKTESSSNEDRKAESSFSEEEGKQTGWFSKEEKQKPGSEDERKKTGSFSNEERKKPGSFSEEDRKNAGSFSEEGKRKHSSFPEEERRKTGSFPNEERKKTGSFPDEENVGK